MFEYFDYLNIQRKSLINISLNAYKIDSSLEKSVLMEFLLLLLFDYQLVHDWHSVSMKINKIIIAEKSKIVDWFRIASKGERETQTIILTISAVVENICGFVVFESFDTGNIVLSIIVRWGLVDLLILWSPENFLFNSGEGGICCLLLLGGFDKPTEPGKKFGNIEISFLIVSNCCLASIDDDDGNVFIV